MRQPGQIAVWIFGVVILAVVILQAGRYSYVHDNSVANYGPSGTSAFAELLRRSGYKVTVGTTYGLKESDSLVVPVSASNEDDFKKFLSRIKNKPRVVAFVIPSIEPDEKNYSTVVRTPWDSQSVGTLDPITVKEDDWSTKLLTDAEQVTLLETPGNQTPIAKVSAKDGLQLVQMVDATCLTNKYIDRADNANVIMSLVHMVAKPGDRVTLLNAFAARGDEDSLLNRLGSPYQAAWTQLLLLILVIFITLSVRFGLAPESRATQRGSRELVDGLASMTRRKRNARWALRAVFERTLAELERRHRIGREQIIQRPDLYMDMDNATRLKNAEAATMSDISEGEAIQHAKELKRLV